jgi:hypothetical protein
VSGAAMDEAWRCGDCRLWTPKESRTALGAWIGTCAASVPAGEQMARYEAACAVFEARAPDFGPKETLTVLLPRGDA